MNAQVPKQIKKNEEEPNLPFNPLTPAEEI